MLKYLLGFGNVRNYDGSWLEWGNCVRVPIAKGSEPDGGVAPAAAAETASVSGSVASPPPDGEPAVPENVVSEPDQPLPG